MDTDMTTGAQKQSSVNKTVEEKEEEENSEASSSEEESSARKAAQALTCRKVTLNNLMEDGIIEAGQGVLSIDYLGQKFEADLLPNGRIKWHGSEEEFGTPSAWALHCKKLVNPIKRSGCGWASVKYKNKKLDIWKSIWARKQRQPTTSKSPQISPGLRLSSSSSSSVTTADHTRLSPAVASPKAPLSSGNSQPSTPLTPHGLAKPREATAEGAVSPDVRTQERRVSLTSEDENQSPLKKSKQDKMLTITLSGELPSPTPGPLPPRATLQDPSETGHTREGAEKGEEGSCKTGHLKLQQQLQLQQQKGRKRESVSYSSLGQRGLDVDPLTLIKCEHFDSLSKIQPFTVSVNSNTLLLMDFHCHMTKSEVVGYLGGRWDCQKQHLSIEQAFPCKCRLGDKEKATFVEEQIQRSMRQKSLMIVGWYHSHPTCPPDPSLRDLDCQMAYQLRMRGSGAIYLPCVGFIISPFEKFPPRQDSKIQAFWVMPNLEHPTSFNIPMHVAHSVVRDLSLTEDLLSDLKTLCEFYSGATDKIYLKEHWGEAITYMDKIKASLRSKLPEDQLDSSTFLDYVQQLMRDMK